MSELELVPHGYVENNLGGEWRHEPVLQVRDNRPRPSRSTSGGYGADAVGFIVVLALLASAFIIVYALVHSCFIAGRWGVGRLREQHLIKQPSPPTTQLLEREPTTAQPTRAIPLFEDAASREKRESEELYDAIRGTV